jgi:hypothetical protein
MTVLAVLPSASSDQLSACANFGPSYIHHLSGWFMLSSVTFSNISEQNVLSGNGEVVAIFKVEIFDDFSHFNCSHKT